MRQSVHSSPGSPVLCVQVGRGLHGTAIQGQDDRDEMGICVEPAHYVIGLDRFE